MAIRSHRVLTFGERVMQLPLTSDRLHTAECFVEALPDCFRQEFGGWLRENWEIYTAFEAQAIKIHKLGREHYGANTIIEYLRHNTLMADKNNEFKINDRFTSSLARLFVLMNPQCEGLFEFRERRDGVVKNVESRV